MTLWSEITEAIESATGEPFHPEPPQAVGGGCINEARSLSDGRRSYFVKTNGSNRLPMFEAEAAGLDLLRRPEGVRVPEPVCHGSAGDTAYLVLEYIPMGRPGADGWARMGAGLAAIHASAATRYGWDRDNTIGTTRQPNTWSSDWAAFFRENRLGFQLRLAADNGHGGGWLERGQRLADGLRGFFQGYDPVPSLLHGDLWSGNADFDAGGAPVIYDPAVYFGDRESDIAMTELFGRFPEAFYDAYADAWPLDEGYPVRRDLYQLYHVLNHLNLFGGGYRASAARLIDRLLAELGQ
ncbi:fructosamine kinase family protein [Ectothiorhodospiraceae bacterium WFHF3C12]|nr:fructosamine kinase family protein [Ectothiorhodospiraceae bacterium WFHF3C12]